MILLKQSTASQEVPLGPFVDATDGVTPETALSIANTDIKIWKAGATSLVNKNSGGGTHMAGGVYSTVFDATDTGTLGSGTIYVSMSGALYVKHDFCVLAANVYDSLVGGGDVLDVSVTQWLGTAAATPATAGHPVVTMKVGTGTGEVNLSSGNVPIRTVFKKAVALTVPFTMRDNAGGPLTGSTVSVIASKDGAAFSTLGTATEIASGWYKYTFSTSDTNCDMLALRFSGSGGSGTPADGGMTIGFEP